MMVRVMKNWPFLVNSGLLFIIIIATKNVNLHLFHSVVKELFAQRMVWISGSFT